MKNDCHNCKYSEARSADSIRITTILSLENDVVSIMQTGCVKPSVSSITITNGKLQCADFEPKE